MNAMWTPATMREGRPTARTRTRNCAARPAAAAPLLAGRGSPPCWRPPRSSSGSGEQIEPGRPSKKPAETSAPAQTIRAARRTRAHADHHRRAGHGDAARHRDHPHPDRRPADGGRLQGRPARQGRRFPRPDRPAPLRGRARAGPRAARQGSGAAAPGADQSRALPDVDQAGLHRPPAGRRPGVAGRAVQGGDRHRPGADRDRRRSISTTPASSRRSTAASACGSSIPATTCRLPTPTVSSW